MLYPDMKYQMHLSLQQERLQQARTACNIARQQTFLIGVWEQFLLRSGEWLISLGTDLKHQVQPEVCVAEAV